MSNSDARFQFWVEDDASVAAIDGDYLAASDFGLAWHLPELHGADGERAYQVDDWLERRYNSAATERYPWLLTLSRGE